MKNKTFILIALIASFIFGANALAETKLPIHSFRRQGTTNHCWAYSAANVIQTRSLLETSTFSELNVEQDLFYWVAYDRLFHRYKTGTETTGLKDVNGKRYVTIPDEELISDYGTPQEFFDAFLKHGHSVSGIRKVLSAPSTTPLILPFMAPKKKFNEKNLDVKKLVQRLDQINNDNEADQLIRSTLDSLMGAPSDYPKMSQKMLPLQTSNDLKLISLKVTKNPKLLHQWDTFSSGRFTAYYVTFEEAKNWIRSSLKQGWAAIVNTDGVGGLHSWTATGERNDQFAAADSRGISEWRTLNASKTESVWIVNTVVGDGKSYN